MQTKNDAMLHLPQKRKASKWRGYTNPPPLTFGKTPPPRNLHKVIHKVAPPLSNKHRRRNEGPRKLHIPGGRTIYWFNDLTVELNPRYGLRQVKLVKYYTRPHPPIKEGATAAVHWAGEYNRRPKELTARSTPTPSSKAVSDTLHALTQKMHRMTLNGARGDRSAQVRSS